MQARDYPFLMRCERCGGVAFYLEEKPKDGDELPSRYGFLWRGSRASGGWPAGGLWRMRRITCGALSARCPVLAS